MAKDTSRCLGPRLPVWCGGAHNTTQNFAPYFVFMLFISAEVSVGSDYFKDVPVSFSLGKTENGVLAPLILISRTRIFPHTIPPLLELVAINSAPSSSDFFNGKRSYDWYVMQYAN
jgi:hypothetical protein